MVWPLVFFFFSSLPVLCLSHVLDPGSIALSLFEKKTPIPPELGGTGMGWVGTAAYGPVHTFSMRKGDMYGWAGLHAATSIKKLSNVPGRLLFDGFIEIEYSCGGTFQAGEFLRSSQGETGAGKIRRDVWNGEEGSERVSGASVSLLY